MCGIFGQIPLGNYSASDLKKTAGNVLKVLSHRGPDDYGYAIFDASSRNVYTEKTGALPQAFKAMLGQTRLSIIDLSPNGHQPMFSDDGRYALVYNGEIYNYIEIRKELERGGANLFHN